MKKRFFERKEKGFRKEQVWDIPTSSDSTLTGQVIKYTVTGAQGKLMAQGYEVCLIAKDESREDGGEIAVTLTPEQCRTLQRMLNSFAYEAEARTGKRKGGK